MKISPTKKEIKHHVVALKLPDSLVSAIDLEAMREGLTRSVIDSASTGLLKTFSSEAARSENHEAYAVRVR